MKTAATPHVPLKDRVSMPLSRRPSVAKPRLTPQQQDARIAELIALGFSLLRFAKAGAPGLILDRAKLLADRAAKRRRTGTFADAIRLARGQGVANLRGVR